MKRSKLHEGESMDFRRIAKARFSENRYYSGLKKSKESDSCARLKKVKSLNNDKQ